MRDIGRASLRMMETSIIYIEDDPKLARLTAKYLESHGARSEAWCRIAPVIARAR